MRDAFAPADSDESIMDKIDSLKQRADETYVVFEARMKQLFSRLTEQLRESTKVKKVLAGLHLYYRSKINSSEVSSLRDLRMLCKRFQPDKPHILKLQQEERKRAEDKKKDCDRKSPKVSSVEVPETTDGLSFKLRRGLDEGVIGPFVPTPSFSVPTTDTHIDSTAATSEAERIQQDRATKKSTREVISPPGKTILPFVVGGDLRGYLSTKVLGVTLIGLLDSGACRTIFNTRGRSSLKAAGLVLKTSRFSHVKVADEDTTEVQGEVDVPFEVGDKVRLITVLYVPRISKNLILGMDFWRRFHFVPDFVTAKCEVNIDSIQLLETPESIKDDVLTEGQRKELDKLLEFFKPYLQPGKLGCVKGVEHNIDTGDSKPFKVTYYYVNPKIRSAVHDELDRRLSEDIVEPSDSPYRNPLLIIPKKDKGFRWVVDFRKLNSLIVTPDSSHPLPRRINPILSSLGGAAILSTIDISDAYLQIPLSPEARAKTAFFVPGRCLFQFKRMPAGLKDAASRWQRTIEEILEPVTNDDPNFVE
ncbi:hypothetical protein FOCC_FOCC012676 [Frankliniella occidentalis]|nr:hypothetical protein FOCC_FOCC012676 [Frankliniella occidentalis]